MLILPVFASFLFTFLVVLEKSNFVCGRSSDICDWVGSGLHQKVPRGVQPLYLRCTQGRIRWQYPRGALRVLLTPPLSKFRGCVRITSNSTGARLYLEGEKRLYLLYRPEDGTEVGRHRCFTSRKGQVALYLEADPPLDLLKKHVVDFGYDLAPQQDLTDEMEECRPCTDNEILRAYCSSDFVVQGTVASLSHNVELQQSELNIRVNKIKRNIPLTKWDSAKYITLHRPLKCGTKAGQGEFVFLGRYRLGLPMVVCAPRLVHWKEIRRKSLAEKTNLCQLN